MRRFNCGSVLVMIFVCLVGILLMAPSFGAAEKAKVDHAKIVAAHTPCLSCHGKPEMGYWYVNKSKFIATRHYKSMRQSGVKGPQQACLSCHVSKEDKFVVNPSENWYDGGGDIEKVSNDMGSTCGKCHGEITKRFAKSLHATKKAVYYSLKELPPPGMKKSFGTSAFKLYKRCASCHASCSSCHLVGKNKEVIDWKYVMANAQRKIDTMQVPITKDINSQAITLAMGPNRNPKSGGPAYRNMARKGMVPIDTVKFDIESHDFLVPTRLAPSQANDVCYRCHENTSKEFYGIGLDNSYGYSVHAKAGMKCTDCHGKDEVHGSGKPELYISKALNVKCETCHEKGKDKAAPSNISKTFFDKAKQVSLTGAHKNLDCSTCHAKFYGSCIACHQGRKARYIETDSNTGKPLIYFGRSVEGKVKIVTTTPRRAIPVDSKDDAGIWMMQSRHSIKKSAYQSCEDCHLDPVKMGVNPLDRAILNKWQMASMGVPKAFINKKDHYAKVKASPQQTCVSCHASKAGNRYQQFHFTQKQPASK